MVFLQCLVFCSALKLLRVLVFLQEPASGGSASGYRQSDYSLPNVYSKLKRAEKRLVEQLEQMGFPQDRLSRAVQRLGCDQAKVICM